MYRSSDEILNSVWDEANDQLRTSASLGDVEIAIDTVGQGAGNGGGSAWAVSGTVSIDSMPAVSVDIPNPLGVSGAVSISGTPGVSLTGGPWPVSGTVSVGNTPAVTLTGGPWPVSGTVSVGNTPSVTINGTPTVNTIGGAARLVGTPTLSGGVAYATGQLLGTKLTLPGAARAAGGTSFVQSITITDLANQKPAMDVILFSANPTGTTFTDHAALDVADTDLVNSAGHFTISAADSRWISFADSAQITLTALGHQIYSADGSLYAALVNRGTPTWAGTSDLQVQILVVHIS